MNRFLTKFNFAIANTAAVLAAMYAAFWFDLDRPYWSMFTVFIVAHPISGAVRSKGVYRLFGTFAGAAMALFLVPPLVQAPYLLSLAMSAWVGLCLTVALFDRTPRSYAFLLAGYTAAIVGFSVADTPLAIFDTAVARFEEVSLGIVCATVAHSVFFPQNVLQALQEQLDATLKTSADKIGEGLLLPADGADRAAQQRLATVLTDLHLLYTHVAYETSDVPRLRPVMRGLIDKLALLLPALTAARAAADALRKSGGIAVPVDGYMRVAAAWIGLPGGAARSAYPALAEQGAAVSRAIEHAAPAWRGLLEGAVVTNVGTLTQALADSRDLAAAIGDPSAALSPHLREAIQGSDRRPLHRDRGLALLSGFAAFAGTLIACVLWIELSWPEGAIAAQFAAISCSLFATLDNPARVLWSAMAGILVTLPLGAVYEFAILPQISDFEMLALVLSPVLMALSYMPDHSEAGERRLHRRHRLRRRARPANHLSRRFRGLPQPQHRGDRRRPDRDRDQHGLPHHRPGVERAAHLARRLEFGVATGGTRHPRPARLDHRDAGPLRSRQKPACDRDRRAVAAYRRPARPARRPGPRRRRGRAGGGRPGGTERAGARPAPRSRMSMTAGCAAPW
ncbi:MAG: FUSC family protein [Rhizomicrobium sp.]